MNNKEKETALSAADCNIEMNMKDARIAIGFFIAGLAGESVSIILRNVDIGHTFFSGVLYGLSDGIGPAAILVGLIYAYTNIKKLREEKERLLNAK